MKQFIKNNLKIVILYAGICLLLLIAIISGITRCVLEKRGNGTTVINGSTFMEMIEEDESFVFVIGQENCDACRGFNNTLRKYTSEGNLVYYMYVDNTQDLYVNAAMNLIKNKIKHELPVEKRPVVLYTPTTFYVEDGLIKDIHVGNFNYRDKDVYNSFKATMNGDNVKRKEVLTDQEFIEKINNNDSFSLVVGASFCGACREFEDTIHKYVVEEKDLYYVYIDMVSSEVRDLIFDKLLNEPPSDREIVTIDEGEMYIGTPVSIYVENGVFKDAHSGYVDYESIYYEMYIDLMNGEYKDTTYPFA